MATMFFSRQKVVGRVEDCLKLKSATTRDETCVAYDFVEAPRGGGVSAVRFTFGMHLSLSTQSLTHTYT